jgi:hypothetical protein
MGFHGLLQGYLYLFCLLSLLLNDMPLSRLYNIDYRFNNEYGAVGDIRSGREIRSIRGKRAPATFYATNPT